MTNQTEIQQLSESIHAAKRIALMMHVSPDGDACGSALALRRALLYLGKEAVAICDDPVPHIYRDLEGADTIIMPEEAMKQSFDLAIAVDVADVYRMGKSAAVFEAARHTAQIDHHHTNPYYAQVNYVRSPLSATGVLILHVIDALGAPLDAETALCLYVAVVTDTGNFKQENTDAEAFDLASRCMKIGISPAAITRQVFDLRPVEQIKLMARALESLKTYADGRLCMMQLPQKDFEETGALSEHTEGIVSYGRDTEGVGIACLLSQRGEKIRGSLRSLPPYDVSRIACALGGGGHSLAAGCTLEPPMENAYELVREEMMKELARHT